MKKISFESIKTVINVLLCILLCWTILNYFIEKENKSEKKVVNLNDTILEFSKEKSVITIWKDTVFTKAELHNWIKENTVGGLRFYFTDRWFKEDKETDEYIVNITLMIWKLKGDDYEI